MMKYLLLLTLALGVINQACADDADAHFAAHFGMSYAINTFSYGLAKEALRMDKTDAIIFSVGLTLMAGAIYKFMELTPDGQGSSTIPKAMLYNALGSGAFVATSYMFKF